jgi:hypothetical protein
MAQDENRLDCDCPHCLLRREIIALKFPLFRPPRALFACPSCGSALADAPIIAKRGRLRHRTDQSGSVDVSRLAPARLEGRRESGICGLSGAGLSAPAHRRVQRKRGGPQYACKIAPGKVSLLAEAFSPSGQLGRRNYPAATAIFLVFLSAFSADKGLVTTCKSSKPIVADNSRPNAVNWLWRRKIRMKNPF